MGVIVITCFKPKKDMDSEMLEVIRDHIPVLRKEGLVTDRECIVMKSESGNILEVFEWKSQDAINDAHKNKNVLLLWERFEKVCEYQSLSDIEESKTLFPGFEPVKI